MKCHWPTTSPLSNEQDLSLSDCMHRFIARDCSQCAFEGSDSETGSDALLDESMALFDVVNVRRSWTATTSAQLAGLHAFGDGTGESRMAVHIDDGGEGRPYGARHRSIFVAIRSRLDKINSIVAPVESTAR